MVHGVTWIGNTRWSIYLEDHWSCTRRDYSVVNAIGTACRDLVNKELPRWCKMEIVGGKRERGVEPESEYHV